MPHVPPTDDELASARTVRTDPGAVDQTMPMPTASTASSGGRRYELRKELGRGGEGTVYLAFDRHAEEVVALKILERVAAGSEDLSRLRRELAMARRITHPGIVRLHDLVEIEGRWALSMEYVEGKSLESRIDSKLPFSADEIVSLARDMAAALAAAHQAGVTHRDLKPANVLLRAGGRPVISDFGISRAHAARPGATSIDSNMTAGMRVTREGALVGTPLYMSPEQLEGNVSAGPIVDVYALGLILFEVATGEVPHTASSLHGIIQRRTTEDAPKVGSLRPDLPPALAAVIDRCLSRDGADRYADGVAVVGALWPERVRGPISRATSELLARSRRRSALFAIVGALTLATLAFGAARWWETPPREPSTPAAAASQTVEPSPPFALRASGHRRVTYDEGCEEFPSFFPDGKRVVFDATVGARSHLFVIDVDSGESRQLTTSPGWDFAAKASPDGKQVVFLRGDDELMGSYVIDAEGAAPARLLIAGGVRPSFTPDGKQVWAGERSRPTRVDVASAAVIEEAPLPPNKQAWHMLALANGDVAVAMPPFMEGNQGGIIVGSSAVGARAWRDLLVDSTEEVLTLSPDGSHFISVHSGPNVSELFALPLGGGSPVRLGNTSIAPGKGLSFSADGKRVVWSTCRSYANVVPLVEKGAPAQAWEDLDGSRLPDGKLLVVSARDGTMKPWIIDAAGRFPPRALEIGMAVADAAASADGSWIVATTPTGLALFSSESKQPARMLTTQAGDSEPNFTHDGRHVLFTRRSVGNVEIHRVSLAGAAVSATGAIGNQAVAFDASDDFLFIEERGGKSLPLVWRTARGVAEPLSPSLPPARYGRPDVSVDGKLVALPNRGTEVLVVNRQSGRVERTLSMEGEQLDRPVFLSDGSLYVTRVRWLGDVWVADLAGE